MKQSLRILAVLVIELIFSRGVAQIPVIRAPVPASLDKPKVVGMSAQTSYFEPAPSTYYAPYEEMIRRQQADALREVDEYVAQKIQTQRQGAKGVGQSLEEEASNDLKQLEQKEAARKAIQERLANAQKVYEAAYKELVEMYNSLRPLSVKQAVFITENAYVENSYSYANYCKDVDWLVELCRQQIPAERKV